MKKYTFALILFLSIFFFSMSGLDVCPGVLGHKALACSACHGGSISGDIFIIGKDEEVENTFVFTVRIPTEDLNFLQLYTALMDDASKGPKVSINYADALLELEQSVLFNAMNLNKNRANSAYTEFDIQFSFDEALTERKTVVLQGVLSNNDGAVSGDQSFYKEIVIDPSESDVFGSNLSLAYNQAYYNNEQVIISNPGKTQSVQIFDLQGKLVQASIVEDYQVMDVADLEKGMYLVRIGNDSKALQSFKFVK